MAFDEQKRFVVMRIAAEALRPLSDSTASQDERAAYIAVSKQLYAVFTNVPPSHANLAGDGTLQDLLTEQLKLASLQVVSNNPYDQSAFKYYIDALTAQVEASRCADCSDSSGHVCKRAADEYNNMKLRLAGRCVLQINRQFEYLCRRVRSMIVRYAHGGDISVMADLNVELSRSFPVGPYPGKPPADTIHFTKGWTTYRRRNGRRESEVILEHESRFFDWSSLLCVTWLCTHELVCHAFQGRAGKERDQCDSHCPFYEGWMDEVAHELLSYFLRHSASDPQMPAFMVDHRSGILSQAAAFRNKRYDCDESPEIQWEIGRRTAEKLLTFFISEAQPGEGVDPYMQGLVRLVRLSYRIQHCDPSSADVGAAVAHVLTLLKHFGIASKALQKGDQQLRDMRMKMDDLFGRSITDFSMWLDALAAQNREFMQRQYSFDK